MPGPSEWVIIAIVAIVVIFGAKKIPEIARSMGRAQSEFKKGVKDGASELDETRSSAATQPPAQAPAQAQAQPQAPPTEPPAEPPAPSSPEGPDPA
jgi:sec-independent protein translocase protein TatA